MEDIYLLAVVCIFLLVGFHLLGKHLEKREQGEIEQDWPVDPGDDSDSWR